MSASDLSIELPIPARLRERLARVPKAPAEGWLTVLALATLLVAMAWAVDEPSWIGGNGARTDYLPSMAFLGLAIGFVGAKAGWGRWTTHLVGAAFAALVLPLISGDLLLGDTVSGLGPAALGQRYVAAADAAYQAWYDLAILDLPFTRQWGHYVIGIGGLIWGTAQYAAYAVFGHRRPLDAVIAVGLVLIANMSITTKPQLHLMVLASIGALMLLSRSHAFEEKATWIRRRIGDPSAVTSLYLRGGSAFIAAAIVGSLTLTATASSSPLQSFWEGVPQRVISALDWLRKILPSGGESGGGIVSFGSTAQTTGVWFSNDEIAFTVDVPRDEGEKQFRWRAATYSDFVLNGWEWSPTTGGDRTAGRDVLATTPEDPTQLPGRRPVTVEIHLDTYRENLVLSPQTVQKVDQPTRIELTTGSRWFTALRFQNLPAAYTVTALVPMFGDEENGLTINRLKAAGENYPSSIQSLYLDVPVGSLGPDGQALLERIRAAVGDKTPYEQAVFVEHLLKDSGEFEYRPDVRGLACDDISMVECFARFKQGYCQYYAATMAILLRALDVPTRYVQGWLPGTRDPSGHEVVRNSGAHAWVEVYFPDIGWVDFDPTGGGFSLEEVIPLGSPVPSRTPGPSHTPLPGNSDDDFGPSRSPGVSPPIGPGNLRGPGAYIAIGILLIISMAGLAYIAWRRGPRRPMEPDVAWRGVLSIARRFGFGPRPAQTVFEYAGALGDEVPQVRPELQTVARGKVEVAYGQRILADDRKRAIAEASRALRVGLLRLAFRRRRRKPKGPRAI